MAIWHLGFSTTKRGTLFHGEAERREAVRVLAQVAGDQLALFSIVYEHEHMLAQEDERHIKALGSKIQHALSGVAKVPLNEPWCERVDGLQHCKKLLQYFLTQPSHHKVAVHDALWTGSCFQDLAGARVIDELKLPIWDLLPGVPRHVIYEHVGLPSQSIEAVTLEQVGVLGAVKLAAAASAALAVDPCLRGRSTQVLRARGVAVTLGQQAQIPPQRMRWALGLTQHGYYGALGRPADEVGMRAVRRRLAIEEAVARATRSIPVTDLGRRLGLCR